MRREWRMAMMAAMKKVLSPISLSRIIIPLFTRPSRNSLSWVILPQCVARADSQCGTDTFPATSAFLVG